LQKEFSKNGEDMHFTKTMAQTIANKVTPYIFPLLHTLFEVKLVEELG
jgi:hypothetical protein